MAPTDFSSMSDDDLLAGLPKRSPSAAPAPLAPAPAAAPAQAAPDFSAMSDDDLLAGLVPRAKPVPKRTAGEDLGRQLGLTVRHAVNGVAAIPAMAADAVAGVANKALDATIGDGKGYRFPNQTQALDNALTKVGLPQAEDAQERVVGDVTAALTGTGGAVKLGRALAKGASSQAGKGFGKVLAADPALQGVSAASAAGASGVVREGGGGEGAQLAAGLVGAIAPSVFRPSRVLTNEGRQTRANAQKAAAEGYVIPPTDLGPGAVIEGLSGFSGKTKTSQVASARNQTISNGLARKALGIGDEVELNIDTLEGIRRSASAAYAPVAASGAVTPGASYASALDRALSPFTSQGQSFPGARMPKVVDDINALRTGQFDAGDALNMIRSMRESADIAYRAGESLSGKAYKQAAGALEDAIEGHLQGLGQPGGDLLKNFRNARQTIAKTYTVQKALNPQTGAVNAIKLGAELAKGKPLSGDLRKVAEFGQAFPKAAQLLKEAPGATSPVDWIPAALTAAATGNAMPLAIVGARPATRSYLLSRGAQKKAVENAGTAVQRVRDSAGAIALGQIARSGDTKAQPETIYRNRIKAGHLARTTGGSVVPVDGGFVVRPR